MGKSNYEDKPMWGPCRITVPLISSRVALPYCTQNMTTLILITLCCLTLQTAYAQDSVTCDGGLSRCDWKPWEAWGRCSKTCGEGTRTRSRGICCSDGESVSDCLKNCGVKDDSFEQEVCGYVCPAGNCSFNEIQNTSIDATNYQSIKDANGKIQNAPILLRASKEFCSLSCLNGDLGNGIYCWTYTYKAPNTCYLYFFNEPLVLAHPDKAGQSAGDSVFVRKCTGEVKCKATQADIVFVVDSSGSIGSENFEKVKAFLSEMVNRLDIAADLTRVGLLVFNDKTSWEFKLDKFDDKLDILKAIRDIKYITGGTKTSEALEVVRTEGFVSNRTGVPKLAVVLTDGQSRYPPLTKVRAALLRQMGIEVYAIGVGNSTNQEELFNLASLPEEKFMYEFSGFDVLDAMNVSLDTNLVDCKEKPSQVTMTPAPEMRSNCTDTVDNCNLYGRDMCTDYEPWARAHCEAFCGFCTGIQTTPRPCVDGIPNCASYGTYICTDKSYVTWVDSNCRKYCGVCESNEITTVPTTTVPPSTTLNICADTIDNCESFLNSCNDPKYRGYLEARCEATCGFCKSYMLVNSTKVNNIDCPEWYIPTECVMETQDPGCCPLPKCPGDNYINTAEKAFTQL